MRDARRHLLENLMTPSGETAVARNAPRRHRLADVVELSTTVVGRLNQIGRVIAALRQGLAFAGLHPMQGVMHS
jgi:hypothetical protein